MNICILFILFNGSAWVTPACYTNGPMIEPHDVVYVQHLPPEYVGVVYESPIQYYNHFRRYRRYVSYWRGYRYNHRHHREWRRLYSPRDRRHYRSYRHRHARRNHHRYNHRNRMNHHHPQRRQPRLKRRTVRRTYDNRGNLRRRVTTRRYY